MEFGRRFRVRHLILAQNGGGNACEEERKTPTAVGLGCRDWRRGGLVVNAAAWLLGCGAFGRLAIPSLVELALVFAAEALVTVGLAALIRWWVTALLERRGPRLDRWRRPWFYPEREVGFFLEALLIVSFLATVAGRYGVPTWGALALFVVWALHLPADLWTSVRVRLRPQATLALHQRGFFLLDCGPLWLRAAAGPLAGGLYFLVPPLRVVFELPMGFLVASLHTVSS